MQFHCTVRQGRRSDTFYLESPSETKVKHLLQSLTTASITSIKKVVYSKKLDIAYHATNHIESKYDIELVAIIKSKIYQDIVAIKYPKQNLDKDTVIKFLKKYLTIKGQPVTNVVNILIKENEGFSPSIPNS